MIKLVILTFDQIQQIMKFLKFKRKDIAALFQYLIINEVFVSSYYQSHKRSYGGYWTKGINGSWYCIWMVHNKFIEKIQ